MKTEWNRYEEYSDGSVSPCSFGIFILGDKKYEVTIIDHTTPYEIEHDTRYRNRGCTHAYEISGLPFYIGGECFYQVGFENFPGLSSVGIDRNPSYGTENYKYCWDGSVPEHTIEEVEHLVEDAFVKAFEFDYDKELEALKEKLDARQRIMDEALSWKELRDYELGSKDGEERE